MELRARTVVDGMWAGLHRSPFHGFSVEFSEYRQYSPGDDLRFLDWKALARTDREYLKIFEDETNLRCTIVLDESSSMQFGSLSHTKFEYSRTLAATLAYFLQKQRDIVGVARFNTSLTDYLQARWRPGHLRRIFALLSKPPSDEKTGLSDTFEALARLLRKRGLIVLVSDFLGNPDAWQPKLAQLTAMGHDVRALQVLDPSEISLEFGKAAYWEDIETKQLVYIDPAEMRQRYQQRFDERQQKLAKAFSASGVRHQIATTNQSLDIVLLSFVKSLKALGGVRL